MENGDAKPQAVHNDSGANVNGNGNSQVVPAQRQKPKQRARRKNAAVEREDDDPSKRRCVSTACIACRYVGTTVDIY